MSTDSTCPKNSMLLVDSAVFQGAPGAKGDTGAKGDAGAKGDTGDSLVSAFVVVDETCAIRALGGSELSSVSCSESGANSGSGAPRRTDTYTVTLAGAFGRLSADDSAENRVKTAVFLANNFGSNELTMFNATVNSASSSSISIAFPYSSSNALLSTSSTFGFQVLIGE